MPLSLWFWSQPRCQKTIPECFSRIVLLSTVSISEPIWQTGICLNMSNLFTFFCSDVKIRRSSPHHLFVYVSKICSALWLLEVSKITNYRVCDSILMHHYTKEPKVSVTAAITDMRAEEESTCTSSSDGSTAARGGGSASEAPQMQILIHDSFIPQIKCMLLEDTSKRFRSKWCVLSAKPQILIFFLILSRCADLSP